MSESCRVLVVRIYPEDDTGPDFDERVHEAILSLCSCRNRRVRSWWRRRRGKLCSIGCTSSTWETETFDP